MKNITFLLLAPVLMVFRGAGLVKHWLKLAYLRAIVGIEALKLVSDRTKEFTPKGIAAAIAEIRKELLAEKALREAGDAAKAAVTQGYQNRLRANKGLNPLTPGMLKVHPVDTGKEIINWNTAMCAIDDRLSCTSVLGTLLTAAADSGVRGLVVIERNMLVFPDGADSFNPAQRIKTFDKKRNRYVAKRTFTPEHPLNSKQHREVIEAWTLPHVMTEVETFFGNRGIFIPDNAFDGYIDMFNQAVDNPENSQYYETITIGMPNAQGPLANMIIVECVFRKASERIHSNTESDIKCIVALPSPATLK